MSDEKTLNDPMTPEELQASRARAEAATAEPWEIEREEIEGLDLFDEEPLGFPRTIGPISYWEHSLDSHSAEEVAQVEADAAFIAHARTDVPRLHATIAARDERLAAVVRLLVENGCNCNNECDHDTCLVCDYSLCLACRIEAAMKGADQ